jgi:hypothetical protein
MRVTLPALLLTAAGLAVSCSDTAAAVPRGRWGGRNAELLVTDAGALALFKCGATFDVCNF